MTDDAPVPARPAARVRVLVVDDHPIFRDGLRAALDAVPDVLVVGEAEDGGAAVTAVGRLAPDVVLMDLSMPGMSGVDAIRRIRSTDGPPVLVLTMHEDDDSLLAAVRAGAGGYVLKGASRDEIVRCLLAVAAGEAVFGPGVAQRVLALASAKPVVADPVPFPELTDRERQVLDLVALGLGNAAIGRRLGISPKTVRNGVSTILAKLQAGDRAEAVAVARRAGLGAQR